MCLNATWNGDLCKDQYTQGSSLPTFNILDGAFSQENLHVFKKIAFFVTQHCEQMRHKFTAWRVGDSLITVTFMKNRAFVLQAICTSVIFFFPFNH